MQPAVLMYARKPLPRPAFQPARRGRRNLLTRLRDEITILRTIEFDHVSIGKALRISPEDTRALSPKTNKQNQPQHLKRHAIHALLKGRYAHLGGKTIPKRAKNLLKIATAYSWDELLEEPGVGVVTATEVQLWLEESESHLRISGES